MSQGAHAFDLNIAVSWRRIMAIVRLVLASASPRRRELLRSAGFAFEVVVADVDERVRPGEAPAVYVRRLAAEKSAAGAVLVFESSRNGEGPPGDAGEGQAPDGGRHIQTTDEVIVLGADTAVVVDGEILGKPENDEEAASMLGRLAGRRHEVMTGISLRAGAYEVGRVETTAVEIARLSPEDIAWYVASGEGRDKAGAYAIQGLASRFVPRIEGSYTNVVGLPIASVVELLPEIRQAWRQPANPGLFPSGTRPCIPSREGLF
jgi:septum formation protein